MEGRSLRRRFTFTYFKNARNWSLPDGDSTPILVPVKSACVNRSQEFLDHGQSGNQLSQSTRRLHS
jgi:hypothetical protein